MNSRNRMWLLVTGGAGYIGRVCAARLVEAGHDVVVWMPFPPGTRTRCRPVASSSRAPTCRQVTGHPIPVQSGPRRPGDPAVLIASSDRAREELGWKPERAELTAIVADTWNFATLARATG